LTKEELRQTVQFVVDAAFRKLNEFKGKNPSGLCKKKVLRMGSEYTSAKKQFWRTLQFPA